ncbi:hypothetical protein TWF281_004482 [Arthrobotrys megalospora]
MGVGPMSIVAAVSVEAFDPLVPISHIEDGVNPSPIYASTLTISTESIDGQFDALDTLYQSLDVGHEPLLGSILCNFETASHQSNICSQPGTPLAQTFAAIPAIQTEEDGLIDIGAPIATVCSTHWHPLIRYINESGNSDPWTVYSFRALEGDVRNDVELKSNVDRVFGLPICPEYQTADERSQDTIAALL